MGNILPKFNKVEDVDLDELKKMSRNLARQVKDSGFTPEHVLYVERAGLLVGFEIAAFFGCGISGILSKRIGSSVKSKFKNVLRHLPRFVTHSLRQLELKSNIHGVNKERNVSCEAKLPPKNQRILIVDDALDTGHSLVAILNFLIKHGYQKELIRIAVLTTTGADPVIHADFSLLHQVTCAFPWSYDSRQYDETQGVYSTEKFVVNNLQLFPSPHKLTN